MKPTFYANKVDVQLGPTELILDYKLKASGRPTETCRVILPIEIGLKLGYVLTTTLEPEPEDRNENEPERSNTQANDG